MTNKIDSWYHSFTMARHKLFFILILILTWPIRWLPYKVIHRLGACLGSLMYYCVPKFRKRALSNLSLATSLNLSEKNICSLAKASMQNLMITCLEYAKFACEKEIHNVATCTNPKEAERLIEKGQPVIFFCGHQANWEVLFLEGSKRMPGVGIGRPIKNTFLYRWILAIRQKYNGKIIAPQNAIREGLRALKKGGFLGIVGDQGMPDSGYSSPFFGREAWSSPIAAILSHRTGSAIIVATTKRDRGKYYIHYSDPIWPNSEAPMEKEVDRLMKICLSLLEEKIAETPDQWLWSHNRWKQQTPEKLKSRFRHETLLIILPKQPKEFFSFLSTFRKIYPSEFITIYAPKEHIQEIALQGAEILSYTLDSDLFKRDFRFKLVFNFTEIKEIKTHFKKLSAFEVVSWKELCHLAAPETIASEILKRALLKNYAS